MASAPPEDLDLWVQELGAFVRSPIGTLGNRCFQLGLSSSKWALRALALAAVLAVCLFMASMIFTWIYFAMMPVKHIEKPVYFDFSMESPVALVSLMGNQWQYQTPSPYNLQPVMTFLTSGVPYDVDVEFTVDSHVAASQSGMLMIEATAEHAFRDKIQPVAHSKRPIEIRKVPTLIHLVRESFLLVPILTGLYSPSIRVKTRVFERFVDFQQFPVSTMNLTLIRAPTHMGEIHLTDAELKFSLHLSGWRYLFYTYFWASAFVLVPLVAFSIFVAALVSYLTMKTPTPTTMRTTVSTTQNEHDETSSGYEPLPSRSPSPSNPKTKSVSPLASEHFDSDTQYPAEKKLDEDDESTTSEREFETDGDRSTMGDVNTAVTAGRHESESATSDRISAEDDQKTAEDGSTSDYEHVGHGFDDNVTVASSPSYSDNNDNNSDNNGNISPSSKSMN